MGITFRPAKRSGVKLMLGLAGPSGCGKTYSALLLAQGIQEIDGGEIFVIDTENRRSEHYADYFQFLIGELRAPFSPANYLEACEAAVKAGAKIIVIDSASHMHEGEGGILEMHDAELDRRTRGDESKRDAHNMAAWIKPKAELCKMVNRLLQIDAHFIFCFRAQEKVKPLKDGHGKMKPTSMGIQPIASERLSYEMVMRLVLPGDEKGIPDLRASATKIPEPLHPIMIPGARINVGLGRLLAEWARGDAAKKPVAITKQPDQAQPSSSPEAPASEAPPVFSSQGGASCLEDYHRDLTAALDEDDLGARHDVSEAFRKLPRADIERARQLYRLHLDRVRGDIGRGEFSDRIGLLLEGVPA